MALLTELRERSFVHARTGGQVAVATWSRETRRQLLEIVPLLDSAPRPQTLHLPGLNRYDYTFTLDPALVDPTLRRNVGRIARALYELRTPRRLILLRDMLFDTFDGPRLHALLSLCRHDLAKRARDPRCALHTPPSVVGPRAGAFALHADLYLGEVLFLVFDEVPRDVLDRAMFLPVAHLRRVLEAARLAEGKLLLDCFRTSLPDDGFERAFDLLHRTKALAQVYDEHLAPAALRIPVQCGDGYLLHDRTWLHGREAPHRGVSPQRFHRLTFNNGTASRAGAPR